MTAIFVVFDAQLLIGATAYAGSTWLDWPRIPPITSNAEADCLGAIASSPHFGEDVSLLISDDLLLQVVIGLREEVGLTPSDIRDYAAAVLALMRASGGTKVADPARRPQEHPDRLATPLALADRFGAMVVAADRELVKMGPRWGPDAIPIVSPDWFRRRVDTRRR